jgi:hypothetical protein
VVDDFQSAFEFGGHDAVGAALRKPAHAGFGDRPGDDRDRRENAKEY